MALALCSLQTALYALGVHLTCMLLTECHLGQGLSGNHMQGLFNCHLLCGMQQAGAYLYSNAPERPLQVTKRCRRRPGCRWAMRGQITHVLWDWGQKQLQGHKAALQLTPCIFEHNCRVLRGAGTP